MLWWDIIYSYKYAIYEYEEQGGLKRKIHLSHNNRIYVQFYLWTNKKENHIENPRERIREYRYESVVFALAAYRENITVQFEPPTETVLSSHHPLYIQHHSNKSHTSTWWSTNTISRVLANAIYIHTSKQTHTNKQFLTNGIYIQKSANSRAFGLLNNCAL